MKRIVRFRPAPAVLPAAPLPGTEPVTFCHLCGQPGTKGNPVGMSLSASRLQHVSHGQIRSIKRYRGPSRTRQVL